MRENGNLIGKSDGNCNESGLVLKTGIPLLQNCLAAEEMRMSADKNEFQAS